MLYSLPSIADVKGYVADVQLVNNQFVIRGWTCVQGLNQSINAHIYLGGAAGTGTFFKNIVANRDNEAAVNQACSTNSQIKHRFQLTLSNDDLMKHGGKKIYVHGINPSGKNLLLTRSGQFMIPKDQSVVKGFVDKVQTQGTGLRLRGWACHSGYSKSTNVHVYAKDANGKRTFLYSAPANTKREDAVKNACRSTSNNHGYDFVIPRTKLEGHQQSVLYVHGIRVAGSVPNNVLVKSTSFQVPKYLNYYLSEFKNGSMLMVKKGQRIIINTSREFGQIHINGGQLLCPSNTKTYNLTTSGIMVMGQDSLFQCGTAKSPFRGKLTIAIKKGSTLSGHTGEAAFAVMDKGSVLLHGDNYGSKWTRLRIHAYANQRHLYLSEPVNWKVGDIVAIAPTGFNYLQAEQRQIEAISGDKKTVRLKTNLSHFHYGQKQNYKNSRRNYSLESRAEVINLTRNIVIKTAGDIKELDNSKFGAHMMVMRTARAYISGVQFERMGQMGEMARYPFHWHRAGNVNGQYIKNSSVTNSYQRCITVHGTNYALVQNNVCFNHFSHGYFLEDGDEIGNKFYHNVGMLSKRPPRSRALLLSDWNGIQRTRFDSPSTFWVSNPNNDFYGNVAAGSQGTGFWMSFVPYLNCSTYKCDTVQRASDANVFPSFQKTLRFDNNIAHSSNVGFTWDGAAVKEKLNDPTHQFYNPNNENDRMIDSSHYFAKGHDNPDGAKPIFRNLTAYKNVYTGAYYRGSESHFHNFMGADNGVNLFIAFDQKFINSLIVGESNNTSASERKFYKDKTIWSRKNMVGFVTYDGPTTLDKVHFAGFPSKKVYIDGVDITPTPIHLFGGASHYEHQIASATFEGNPYYKVHFSENGVGWQDARNHVRVRDVNGSIYGRAGELIVPNHPILFDSSSNCRNLHGGRAKAYGCQYELGTLLFAPTVMNDGLKGNQVYFKATRNDGPQVNMFDRSKFPLNNKLGTILGKGYSYRVQFDRSKVLHPGYIFEADYNNRKSPTVIFDNVRNCSIRDGARRVSSWNDLNNSNENVYLKDANGIFYVRAFANTRRPIVRAFQSNAIRFSCP